MLFSLSSPLLGSLLHNWLMGDKSACQQTIGPKKRPVQTAFSIPPVQCPLWVDTVEKLFGCRGCFALIHFTY